MDQVLEWTGWSGREWARRAKLKEENHVNLIMQRLRDDAKATVDAKTLIALADAADVSLDWFARGIGSPQGHKIEPDGKYPSRSLALAAARLIGVDRGILDEVRKMADLAADPGAHFWLHQILARAGLPTDANAPSSFPPPASERGGLSKKRRQKR
jgi:hypothetical protein